MQTKRIDVARGINCQFRASALEFERRSCSKWERTDKTQIILTLISRPNEDLPSTFFPIPTISNLRRPLWRMDNSPELAQAVDISIVYMWWMADYTRQILDNFLGKWVSDRASRKWLIYNRMGWQWRTWDKHRSRLTSLTVSAETVNLRWYLIRCDWCIFLEGSGIYAHSSWQES